MRGKSRHHTFLDGAYTGLLSMRRDRGIVGRSILRSTGRREVSGSLHLSRSAYVWEVTNGAVWRFCFFGISDIFARSANREAVTR